MGRGHAMYVFVLLYAVAASMRQRLTRRAPWFGNLICVFETKSPSQQKDDRTGAAAGRGKERAGRKGFAGGIPPPPPKAFAGEPAHFGRLTHARGLSLYRGARRLRATVETAKPARRRNRSKKHFAGGGGPLRLRHPRGCQGAPLRARVCFLRFGGVRCVVCCRLGAVVGAVRLFSVRVSFRRCSFLVAAPRGSSLVVGRFAPSAVAAAGWVLAGFVASCFSGCLRSVVVARLVRCAAASVRLVVSSVLGSVVAASRPFLALRVLCVAACAATFFCAKKKRGARR